MCGKVVADMLSEGCEINNVLRDGQIEFRRQRSTIDSVVRVINQMQKACMKGKIVGMQLTDIKGEFGHGDQNYLLRAMVGMGMVRGLVR